MAKFLIKTTDGRKCMAEADELVIDHGSLNLKNGGKVVGMFAPGYWASWEVDNVEPDEPDARAATHPMDRGD